MSIEKVREYLKKYGKENDILEFSESSATVELAAKAAGVIPARIVKTLSFKSENGCILICAAGDTKIDNKKFKDYFSIKAKMLTPEEVVEFTGHAIGGVCPFGIDNPLVQVFCDESIRRFETVFPAAGSSNSAVELSPEELYQISRSTSWIDVCKIKEESIV